VVFRFRPRFRALPYVCAILGPAILVVALLAGASGNSLTFAIAGAVIGPLIVTAYLASPAWRFRVETDDEGLAVWHGRELRFRVPWWDVRRLVHSPSTRTCYVDGGVPSRSLLVPGPGAPASYLIERREELYDTILAHVPEERRETVELIELAMRAEKGVV
jgi:hypothetical protein